jgi:osmotically-inducible protein OsmY
MTTDHELKIDVEDELQWDPEIESTHIAVTVADAIVTLAGFVRDYREKVRAGLDAKRVDGVAGVMNEIDVRLPLLKRRADSQIARNVLTAIRNCLRASFESIQISVRDGHLTLDGEVEWTYQKDRAEGAASKVRGVRALSNAIRIKARDVPVELKQKIGESVDCAPECQDAERTVRDTPGENRLEVRTQ